MANQKSYNEKKVYISKGNFPDEDEKGLENELSDLGMPKSTKLNKTK